MSDGENGCGDEEGVSYTTSRGFGRSAPRQRQPTTAGGEGGQARLIGQGNSQLAHSMRWAGSRKLKLLRTIRIWSARQITFCSRRCFSSQLPGEAVADELKALEPVIRDDYANLKEHYSAPKYPIVLAHGLMGFDELRLAGKWLPGVEYWRGVKQALQAHHCEVITTSVPTTGSIEERAEALHQDIRTKAAGKDVNIVAHSMGGLDSRYLISRIQPQEFRIKSLTTIATPHRGSCIADMLLRDLGPENVDGLYRLLARMKVATGAFAELTTTYINERFNPVVPNDPQVRYMSFGAAADPHALSVFKLPHDLMEIIEGPNDGLVSVASSRWGEYKGTLMGVTHLDLINWTNRFKRLAARLSLITPNFNAIAFYLAVADMLSKEGL